MILENACEFKDYLGSVFDAMGFYGNFEVVGNDIHLNIVSDNEKPTKEQVLEKLKEITLKKKKQELEAKINAICKEKITKAFRSSVLGSVNSYDLTLEDQANLQALVVANIDSVFRCAEVNNGVLGDKTYKKHTKEQILQLSKEALKFKMDLIVFYGREKERLKAISRLEELEKFKIKEYEGFFSEFNTSMKSNEQEVTSILNANAENIKSEIKKLENQLIETTTKLLTSYQIFLNNAKESANNQITANKTESLEAITQAKESANNQITETKTQSLEAIKEAKESATTQINTNKTQSLEAIKTEKQQATSEINEAKKAIIIKTLIFLRLNKAC